jgi:hypothetical protein
MAHYVALTCKALARWVYGAAATSPHTVNVRFFRQGLHNTPRKLRHTLQDEIDSIAPGACDAILLVYGLCGLATAGLTARHAPVVIARAHDCITLYLGSRERYQAEFDRHPGTYWYSVDYLERQEAGMNAGLGAAGMAAEEGEYEKWVAKYGQETADMLLEEMRRWARHYTRAAFIDTGAGDGAFYENLARAKAAQEGWLFERLPGDRRLVEMLIRGEWSADEFLVIQPGQTLRHCADERIVEAVAVQT